mmetsp:Transcript_27281/g.24161  ORF Transcript_27281/g.24161 Transcript_27281/m.24161 type:complete len:135 (+) Transcript_27281:255-659(+)
MRKQYEDCRKEFFSFEQALDQEKPSLYEEEDKEKEELLNGIEELNRQEREIDNIINMGIEGHDAQRNAAKNLRDQRGLLVTGAKNTNKTAGNLRKAHRQIEIVSIRNMVYVGSLYGIAIVLALITICILILKII